jgi:hypothetical protein
LRKWMLFSLVSFSIVSLAGCQSAKIAPMSEITASPTPIPVKAIQNTKIDWVDFLKLNGVSYTASFHGVLTDSTKLGKVIGKVGFQVSDNVHDPQYVTKDGDAAFLAQGTDIHAIDGYPDHEIVAVADNHAIGGFKLYIADDKRKTVEITFEEAVKHEIVEVGLYPSKGNVKPMIELKDGSQLFLISMFQRTVQEKSIDVKLGENLIDYSFVIDSGKAIGYADTIYKDGNNYYWNHNEVKQLQNAFGYYFAKERDVVFTIQGMDFALPNHMDTVNTGERIKRGGSMDNITLLGVDGVTERSLFTQNLIDQIWKKAKEINPSDGEAKAILYMADRAMPVSGGRLIAYTTNKDTIVKRKNGSFSVNLIGLDGTGDRMIMDGSKYGGYITLLDSVGDKIVAEGGDRSLLEINITTGEVRHFAINAMPKALSVDGKYVLSRKMVDNANVGTELAAFDLNKGTSIELGAMPENFIFEQGIK